MGFGPQHARLDCARLEIVLRIFLRGFDGGIDRCDFRSARYPQSPVQHWVLRLGLFLIPASFQVVRHDATNVRGDVWGGISLQLDLFVPNRFIPFFLDPYGLLPFRFDQE